MLFLSHMLSLTLAFHTADSFVLAPVPRLFLSPFHQLPIPVFMFPFGFFLLSFCLLKRLSYADPELVIFSFSSLSVSILLQVFFHFIYSLSELSDQPAQSHNP